MAKQVVQTLIDDIDGSPASRTVLFALDGKEWSIDLNDKHEAELRNKLNPFVEGARRVRAQVTAGRPGRAGDRDRNTAIRAWAAAEGVELSARGRIPNAVQSAFEAQDGDALRAAFGLELVADKPKRGRRAARDAG